MKNCIFAGTFDPITVGHVETIKECALKYDNVLVVIGVNKEKAPLFSEKARLNFVKKALSSMENVKIYCYSEIDDYGKFILDNGITFYVRGIRNDVDYNYEKQFESVNKRLYPTVKTVYLKAKKEQEGISSSLIRERLKNGEDLSEVLPESIKEEVVNEYKSIKQDEKPR